MMSSRDDPPAVFENSRSSNSDVTLLNWPLIQDGWRSVFYVSLTAAVTLVTGYVTGHKPSAVLAALAIVLSMWRFWLPVRFHFNYNGITQTVVGHQRLIPWRFVRRCEALRHGLLFYFTTDRSPLSFFSSLYVDWRDRRDDLLRLVESRTRNSNSPSRRVTPDRK